MAPPGAPRGDGALQALWLHLELLGATALLERCGSAWSRAPYLGVFTCSPLLGRLRFSSACASRAPSAPLWSLAPHLGGAMHARPMQRGLAALTVSWPGVPCRVKHFCVSFLSHTPDYTHAVLSHVSAWHVTTTRNTPSRRDACTCFARVSSAQVSFSSSFSFTLQLEGNCS